MAPRAPWGEGAGGAYGLERLGQIKNVVRDRNGGITIVSE